MKNKIFYNITKMNSLMNSKMNSKLLRELQNQFTEEEQVVFVNSFYMYLNYHPTEDFVIDLGDVYEMIGFAEKGKAKRLLENNFTENEDYKIALAQTGKRKNEGCFNKNPRVDLLAQKGKQVKTYGGAGLNKESIMLNVDTFKNLCMIARTEKAKKIRMYYVKMENINMGIIKQTIQNTEEKQKMIGKSEQIMEQFDKKPVVYIGLVEQTMENQIVKYGHTGDIKSTLKRHKSTYGEDFNFIKAIECNQRHNLEKKLQNHNVLATRHVKNYNGNPRQELLRLDESFNLENLEELISSLEQEKQEPLEVLVEQEKTKQIEAQEKTKQLQLELEILKLKTNLKTIPKTKPNQEQIVKKYIELVTEHSIRNSDNVLIEDLYNRYGEWYSIEYPGSSSVSKTIFNTIIDNCNEYTKKRIAIGPRVNNVTPRKTGITNRKFKQL